MLDSFLHQEDFPAFQSLKLCIWERSVLAILKERFEEEEAKGKGDLGKGHRQWPSFLHSDEFDEFDELWRVVTSCEIYGKRFCQNLRRTFILMVLWSPWWCATPSGATGGVKSWSLGVLPSASRPVPCLEDPTALPSYKAGCSGMEARRSGDVRRLGDVRMLGDVSR